MYSIYLKELRSFFSSTVAYVVMITFLVFISLFMWVFSETNVLTYNYAGLDQLFVYGPLVFLFLIPAITMRNFSEEYQKKTIEFLRTKPLKASDVILGKYFANLTLLLFTLLPTLVYYYSVYQLGSPVGNLDTGAIIGSYIGLFMLGASFIAIGMYASSLTSVQISAFILASFFCFFIYWSFYYLSKLPVFIGSLDLFIQKLGLDYHYNSISKGLIDTRDLVYFISLIVIFLLLSLQSYKSRK